MVPCIIVGLLLVSTRVESGFATFTPGPAPAVELTSAAKDPTFGRGGSWHFTTVAVEPVSVAEYLLNSVRGTTHIRVNSDEHSDALRQSVAQMTLSQEVAWAVAYDASTGGLGAAHVLPVITDVKDGSPAATAGLRVGDTIVALDGQPAAGAEALRDALARTAGAPATLRVERGDDAFDVAVATARSDGEWRLGVELGEEPTTDTPVSRPRINAAGVGGPSAGLLFSLGYLDALTSGDLTGGQTIAGTGTIAATGKVGPIDGVDLKVRGALDVGATVFLSPVENFEAAKLAAAGRLEVVPVATFAAALAWVCDHGGVSTRCPTR